MTKRVLAIALVVMMLCGLFAVAATLVGAESAPDVVIATVDELLAFAEDVNNGDTFAGKKVQLVDDLDLAGIQWQPIGGSTVYFAGEFDGNGKTISNLTNTEDVARKGLFGLVEDCYIHDLTLKDVKFSGAAAEMRVGALAGNLNNPNWNGTGCIIKNVTVDGLDYDLEDTDGIIGGLIGFSWNSYVKNCVVKNATMDITSTAGSRVGTVIGYGRGVTDNCYVEDFPTYGANNIVAEDVNADGGVINYVDCRAEGATVNLSGTVTFGGFFGADTYNHWRNTFKNCDVVGLAVTCAADDGVYTVGGFMGAQAGGYSAEAISNCDVSGTITGNGTNTASTFAGFIGGKWGRTGGATNCTADVDITATAGNVAGFCGSVGQYNASMSYAFNGCVASGNVETANGVAGGFLATASGDDLNVALNNNVVTGTAQGTTAATLVANVASTTGVVELNGNTAPEGPAVGGNLGLVVDRVVADADIVISTVEEFTAFAAAVTAGTEYEGFQVANNKDVVVVLNADLNLDGVTWGAGTAAPNAIGNGSNNAFCGTFDGNGHTISNYSVTGAWSYNRALFRTVGDGFTIKNITFDNCKSLSGTDNPTQKTGGAAIVCGGVSGTATFENVTVKNSRVEGNRSAAAIAAFGNKAVLTFTDCTVENVDIVSGERTGILAAYVLADYAENDIIASGNTANDVTWIDETGADRTANLVGFHKESAESDGEYDNYTINGEKIDTTIVINTLDDLKAFAAAVNAGDNFAGKTVKLGADLTFGADDYWYYNDGTTVVDYQIKNFAGTFDGQGHTITGLKFYTEKTGKAMGLFGTIEATGSVKNLTLNTVTAEFAATTWAHHRAAFGLLALNLNGTAENCHIVDATVTTNAYSALREGGIMFTGVSGTATKCTVTNAVINSQYDGKNGSNYNLEDMGGFAGVVTGTLDDCHIDGIQILMKNVGYSKKVGGFIGRTNNNSVVTGCTAKNVTIDVQANLNYVGGFVGHAENGGSATYTDCTVENVIITSDNTASAGRTGGFVGEAYGVTFENCDVNGATINVGVEGGTKQIGSTAGFCGQTNNGGATFENCDVTGLDMTVAGVIENGLGGFLTSTGGNGAVNITGCSVAGTIDAENATSGAVGGFLGNLGWGGSAATTITASSADVDVTANGNAGGFVGKATSSNANATLTITDCSASGDVTSENGEAHEFAATGSTGDPATGEYTFTGEIDGADLVINTLDDLKAFAAAVNAGDNFAGKTVKLGNDIEVNDYWFNNETGVDFRITKDFAGTFDGNGFAIKGLKFQNTNINTNPSMYLFSSISGAVKNLTLDGVDADINDRDCFGFIAYKLTGTAENCHVKNVTVDVAVNASGTGYMYSSGAMFGQIAGAQVDGCTAEHVTFNPTGTDNMDNIGALIGTASGDGEERSTVTNCSVTDVNYNCTRKTKRTGGFIGSASNTDFTDCTVTDLTIKVDTYYQSIGGFIGNASTNSTYTRCHVVNFTLIGNSTDYAGDVGGFAAYTGSSTDIPVKFTDCSVTGLDMDLTCNDNNDWVAGGFLGYATSNVDIDGCTVEGDITVTGNGAEHELGSFVGTLDWTSNKDITIDNSTTTVPGEFIGENSFGNTLIIDGVEITFTNWIQKADTSWYVEGQTEFTLTTAEQLAGLAQLVNEGNPFTAIIIRLGADIDLTDLEWTPIGLTAATPFSGHFDGQEHTITGLNMATAYENAGLFGYIKNNTVDYLCSFENVTFHNVAIANATNAGALFGDGKFAQRHEWYGGILQIHNVNVTGVVQIDAVNAGALTGSEWLGARLAASNVVVNVNEGSYVHGSAVAGGVFASTPHSGGEDALIQNITSNIHVVGEGFVGGIAGRAGWILDGLTYTGTITATGTTNAGLIFGQIIDNTYWSKNVDLVGMTDLNGEGATLTIDGVASEQLFPTLGWSGKSEFAYADGKVREKTALVSIDGGEGVLMTWPEAMVAIEGKTAEITLTLANGATWVYEYGIKVPAGTVLTIDLNGNTLEGTIFSESNLTIKNGSLLSYEFTSAVESYGENAVLTIEDGVTIKSYRHAIRAEGGKVIINGGVFQTWGRTGEAETVHAINAGGAFATEVIINGGEFRGLKYDNKAENPDSSAAVNAQNNAIVYINGGKFGYGQNNTLAISGNGQIVVKGGEFDQDPAAFVPEGYRVVASETEGWFVVKVINYVAEVGGVKYESIQAAIDAAAIDDTIKLIADVTEEGITVAADDKIVIDLDGHTLYGDIYSEGNLIIKNGSIKGTRFVSTIEAYGANARLETWDLEVISYRHALRIEGARTFIHGGTYQTLGMVDGVSDCHALNAGGAFQTIVDIYGGTFIGPKGSENTDSADSGSAIQAQANAKVYIVGGYDSVSAYGGQNDTLKAVNEGKIIVRYGLFDQDPSAHAGSDCFVESVDDPEGWYTVFTAAACIYRDGNAFYYATLQAAINAVQDGETIDLYQSIRETSLYISGKTFTLDLSRNKLDISGDWMSMISIVDGSNVTITDTGRGSITGGGMLGLFSVGSGSTLTFDKKVTIDGKLFIESGSANTIVINGGTYSENFLPSDISNSTVTKGAAVEIAAPAGYFWKNDTTLTKAAAQIGDTYYATVEDAFAAAKAGDTITLLKDCVLTKGIKINRAITLDMNGHTLSADKAGIYMFMIMADVTITGDGAITATGMDEIFNVGNVTLTLNGNVAYSSEYNVLRPTGETTVAINGGSFTSEKGAVIDMTSFDNATITKADAVEITAPAGYFWKNGTTLTEAVASLTAPDGTVTLYDDVTAAMKQAQSGNVAGDYTLVLLKDCTLGMVTGFGAVQNVVLDLNGYTLTVPSYWYTNNGDVLIIRDGSVMQTGKIVCTKFGAVSVTANGTLILESGTLTHDAGFYAGYAPINQAGSGKVYINGGAVIAGEGYYAIGCGKAGVKDGLIEVNGGTISGVIYVAATSGTDTITFNEGDFDITLEVGAGFTTVITKAAELEIPAPEGYFWRNDTTLVGAGASVTDENGSVTYYNTFNDALTAAKDGDTITLLDNVTLTRNLQIFATKGTLTLDLNGYTLDTGANQIMVYNDLTVTGNGTVKGVYDCIFAVVGKLTIEGNATYNNPYGVILPSDGATVVVNGGNYPLTGIATVFGIDCDLTNITKAEAVEILVPNGYGWINNKLAMIAVAQIFGRTELYLTLQDAIDAVRVPGQTIVLLADIELTAGVVIPADKTLTLDLNGHTISYTSSETTGNSAITNKGDLTIKGEGKITYASTAPSAGNVYATNTILNGGKLTVLGGTIENTTVGGASYAIDTAWYNTEAPVVIIEGGKIVASGTAIRVIAYNDKATVNLTVNGGEIVAKRPIWIQLPGSDNAVSPLANVTINGGTVTSVSEIALYVYSYGNSYNGVTVAITGGTITGEIGMHAGSAYGGLGSESLTISGGTFLSNEYNAVSGNVYVYGNGATDIAVITDGKFDQDPSQFVADGLCAIKDGEFYIIIEAAVQVGDSYYATLQDAIDAAGNGDTVTLLTDISVGSLYISGKTFTLDLNGKTLDVSGDWMSMISIVDGSNVTIDNGTVTGGGMLGLFTVGSGSTLTFGENVEEISGKLFIESGSANTIVINGGTYSENFLPSDISNSTVTKGAAVEIIAPEGYFWKNGTELTEAPVSVTIGDITTYYETLDEAMKAAYGSNSIVTVKLLGDAEYTLGMLDVFMIAGMNTDNNITLDLNGKTVTVTGEMIALYGNSLTITGNGTMIFTGNGALRAMMTSNGTTGTKSAITIENGTFINETDGTVIIADANAMLTINDGTFTTSENIPVIGVAGSGTVTLNAGTYPATTLKVTGLPSVTKTEGLAITAPEGYFWANDTTLTKASVSVTVGDITTYYETLDEAWDAALAAGNATIKVLKDTSFEGYISTNFTDVNITLDLNGKAVVLTGYGVGVRQGTVTITGNGTMNFGDNAYLYAGGASTLTIGEGTYTNASVAIGSGATVTKDAEASVAAPEGYFWENDTTLKKAGIFSVSNSISFEDIVFINKYVSIIGLDPTIYTSEYIESNGGMLVWYGEGPATADAVIGNEAADHIAGLQYSLRNNVVRYGQSTSGIAPKNYGDDVFMRVYLQLEDGTYLYSDMFVYSIETYCHDALRLSNNEDLKKTARAMLHYGAAAQLHFNYKTDDLINEGIEPVAFDNSMLTPTAPVNTTLKATDYLLQSQSVSYNGDLSFNFYYNLSGNSWQYIVQSGTLQIWYGDSVQTEENCTEIALQWAGGRLAASTEGFNPLEYEKTIYVRAKIVDMNGVVHYSDVTAHSIEAYAAIAIDKGSATMKDLARMSVVYGECAKTYLNNRNK